MVATRRSFERRRRCYRHLLRPFRRHRRRQGSRTTRTTPTTTTTTTADRRPSVSRVRANSPHRLLATLTAMVAAAAMAAATATLAAAASKRPLRPSPRLMNEARLSTALSIATGGKSGSGSGICGRRLSVAWSGGGVRRRSRVKNSFSFYLLDLLTSQNKRERRASEWGRMAISGVHARWAAVLAAATAASSPLMAATELARSATRARTRSI